MGYLREKKTERDKRKKVAEGRRYEINYFSLRSFPIANKFFQGNYFFCASFHNKLFQTYFVCAMFENYIECNLSFK
jgi:hypothetical protein